MSAATAPGARLERADEDRISIILPGDWARIPLESEADANAEITRLIRGRFPRRDELATMRRETREMMRAIARDARESDAALLAMSLELVPGLPFAAGLLVHYIDVPHPELEMPLEVRLASAVPAGEVLELDSGLVGREREVSVPGPENPDATTTIRFHYVVPTPFEGQWAKVYVNVPTEAEPELIAALFDAIVDTIRWYPDAAPMGSAPHSGADDPLVP
jgi:hypothetical protein